MSQTSLEYLERSPAPALRPFVEACYVLRGQAGAARSYRILPDGCLDLVLDLSDDRGPEACFLIGATTGPARVELPAQVAFLGARFRPGGLAAFTRVPASELTDRRAELGAIWGRGTASLLGAARESASWGDRVRSLEDWLLQRCSGARPDGNVLRSVALLRQGAGRTSMRQLERASDVGMRQLERRFRHCVGLTPKCFAMVMRFQSALAILERASPTSLTRVAYEAGYADQAHFSKEFRRFTGFSPTAWPGRHQRAGCPE